MSGGDITKRPAGRKLAEWVTMGLSALLVLSVAGYLAYEAVRDNSSFVPVKVRVLAAQAQPTEGHFLVPIEVRNAGQRTLSNLRLRLTYRSADASEHAEDLSVDYLGERASQTIYLYLDRDPQQFPIVVRPVAYQLE